MYRRKPLVSHHLEQAKGQVLARFQKRIGAQVGGRHGVYALYRRNKLYYVGLAGNLKRRLRRHLSDRHAGLWDRFSVYLTVDHAYLKEIESLVLRIVATEGNRVKGKFLASRDLNVEFEKLLYNDFREEVSDLLGKRPRVRSSARKATRQGSQSKRPLAGVFRKTVPLRKRFKGKWYKARLRPDGRILYAGSLYDSPSSAGSAVAGRPVNGWRFWTFEVSPKKWAQLEKLRR
jgi:hypothetical protein